MRTKLRLLWYWLETRYAKLLRLFGVVRSTDYIPDGMYCMSTMKNATQKSLLMGIGLKLVSITEVPQKQKALRVPI